MFVSQERGMTCDQNKNKKQCSWCKTPFYYLKANKTLDVFHNLGPLASLKLKKLEEEMFENAKHITDSNIK